MNAEELRDRILAFVSGCKNQQAVVKEEGVEPMPLEPGRFSVEARQGKVLLEVWDESRSLVRRITEVRRETISELALAYRRFGPGQGLVRILATAKRAPELRREAERGRFAGRLRKLLAQTFPGWKLEELSVERDLEHAFSAKVTRAVLRQAQAVWAVVGCAEEEGEAAAGSTLTQGLAWLHYLRQKGRRTGKPAQRLVTGLKVFLPERYVADTALRWSFLNRELAEFELFAFSPQDEVRRAEEIDRANLATELPAAGSRFCCSTGVPPAGPSRQDAGATTGTWNPLFSQLAALPGVRLVRTASGPACRIRGLEFARMDPEGAVFGFGDGWRPLSIDTLPDAEAFAGEIARLRAPDSPDRHHPFYTAQAERWLESLLLTEIERLSGELDPGHVYSQVPAIVGRQRGIIDLLAATRSGRLVVIEVKASADPNLPLQALDYWMRVKWHFERGEFQRLGYFPDKELRPEPPWLWLVAPVFEFHPLTEVVLRYLSKDVPVRRIGVSETWRESIQVVYRA